MPSFDPNRPWRQLYGSKWNRLRLRFLDKHPLCIRCLELGRTEAATVVDHIQDHKGNLTLFWSQTNWQPLCVLHHNSWKRRGSPAAVDAEGYPKDGSW